MREGSISAVRNPLSAAELEDAKASSYASGTGLYFVIVIVALSAIVVSLVSLGAVRSFQQLPVLTCATVQTPLGFAIIFSRDMVQPR